MILMGKDDTEVHTTLSNFSFSGVDVTSLDDSEYTLVTILVDMSGSVTSFKDQLEATLGTIIDSCMKSPKAENILVRVAGFNSRSQGNIIEFHGFKSLSNISVDAYKGTITPTGATPLYDAAGDALESIESYGKLLVDQEYLCNGIFFVITDGDENCSSTITDAKQIKLALDRIRRDEVLESIKAILIGVNDTALVARLKEFELDGGFDEYISLGDISAGKLAKLANWVSKSISSQSQSLGSGGPSQPIDFTL